MLDTDWAVSSWPSNVASVLTSASTLQGLTPLEGHDGETVTKGLEDLKSNCQQYYRCDQSNNRLVV